MGIVGTQTRISQLYKSISWWSSSPGTREFISTTLFWADVEIKPMQMWRDENVEGGWIRSDVEQGSPARLVVNLNLILLARASWES